MDALQRERDAPVVPGFVRDRLPASVPGDAPFVALLVAGGVFGGLLRLFRLAAGRVDLHPDVRLVWYPLARAVADGTPLYTAGAMDNKPPLFELLGVAAFLTDHYVAVMVLATGLANGVAAALLWRVCSRRGCRRVGALAALAFLWTLPLVDGTVVNVRSFAVAGVLFALATRRAVLRGVGLACAVLCSQYAALAVPVVAWDGYVRSGHSRHWLVRFVAAGSLVVTAVYGAVLVVWGWASLAGAAEATVGTAAPYLTEFGPSLWVSTGTWLRATLRMHLQLWVVLALAVWGLWRAAGRVRTGPWDLSHLVVALLVALSLPLLVRPFVTYWLYPLPAIAVLVARGIEGVLSGGNAVDRDGPTGRRTG